MLFTFAASNQHSNSIMPLDKKTRDIPYLLGRIAAIIEQSVEMSPNRKNQAQETPYIAFPWMFARYHDSAAPARSEEIMEIMDMLPGDFAFPERLTPEEQGRFIIGRSHELVDIHKVRTRNKVAEAVRLKRTKLRMTQEQVASQSGITKQTICKIESGDSNVSLDVLSAVMAVLDITMTVDY